MILDWVADFWSAKFSPRNNLNATNEKTNRAVKKNVSTELE